ncbi:LOW QUALITY PROTEIN: fetuin-B [Eudromia elegans]
MIKLVLCPARAAPGLLLPCRDGPAVEEAADLALQQINIHRREGYVLSLYRVASARGHPQEIIGSLFCLILDIVDSNCPVLSKKRWKDCESRPAHETVRTSYFISGMRVTQAYGQFPCTCIWATCPDCPYDCPTESKQLEVAAQSLAKFNEESEQTHYFSVLNVTKASMLVASPAHLVEFTIQETSCSKSDSVTDFSKCQPLSLNQLYVFALKY